MAFSSRIWSTVGSLSRYDDDGNKIVIKQFIGFNEPKRALHVHYTFWYIIFFAIHGSKVGGNVGFLGEGKTRVL